MIRINLLPVREAHRKERLRNQLSVLILTLVLTGVICLALYGSMAVSISSQADDNRALQAQIQQLQQQIGKVNEYKKLKADLEAKLKILADLKRKKKGPVHLLDELSAALPDKLWLNLMDQKGQAVELKGVAMDEPILADFMRRLETSPYWATVELKVVEKSAQGADGSRTFTLGAVVEVPVTLAAPPQPDKR